MRQALLALAGGEIDYRGDDGPCAGGAARAAVSDRRLRRAARLLRLVAYTSGRARAHAVDCVLLRHVLPAAAAADVTEGPSAGLTICAIDAAAEPGLDAPEVTDAPLLSPRLPIACRYRDSQSHPRSVV